MVHGTGRIPGGVHEAVHGCVFGGLAPAAIFCAEHKLHYWETASRATRTIFDRVRRVRRFVSVRSCHRGHGGNLQLLLVAFETYRPVVEEKIGQSFSTNVLEQ